MTDIQAELDKFQIRFDELEKTAEADLALQGKRLEQAQTPHPTLQHNWGKLGAGLSWLYEEAKNDADTAFGQAYTNAQNDSYKTRSSTDAKWIAEKDDRYNKAVRIKNKVYRLKKEVDNVTDVIESRKYILKDLTNSIIHSVNNSKLYI